MDKKAYILKVLNALEKTRSLAPWLKALVEDDALNQKTLDALLHIFKSAVNQVQNWISKEKLQKSIVITEKIKSMETQEKKDNQNEIDKLDQLLKDF